jgi:hypothetical protein
VKRQARLPCSAIVRRLPWGRRRGCSRQWIDGRRGRRRGAGGSRTPRRRRAGGRRDRSGVPVHEHRRNDRCDGADDPRPHRLGANVLFEIEPSKLVGLGIGQCVLWFVGHFASPIGRPVGNTFSTQGSFPQPPAYAWSIRHSMWKLRGSEGEGRAAGVGPLFGGSSFDVASTSDCRARDLKICRTGRRAWRRLHLNDWGAGGGGHQRETGTQFGLVPYCAPAPQCRTWWPVRSISLSPHWISCRGPIACNRSTQCVSAPCIPVPELGSSRSCLLPHSWPELPPVPT